MCILKCSKLLFILSHFKELLATSRSNRAEIEAGKIVARARLKTQWKSRKIALKFLLTRYT